MKTFFEFLESCSELGYVHLNEGLFDKLFQKAMDKLAVLVGPERMGRLEAVLKKYDGQKKIDKKALEKELNGTFKTFKLDGSVAKEIQNECVDESGEPVNETVANMLIAANYGFWTAVFVKAALGIGIPMVLGIIRAAVKNSGRARSGKNAFAKAKKDLDDLNRQMR